MHLKTEGRENARAFLLQKSQHGIHAFPYNEMYVLTHTLGKRLPLCFTFDDFAARLPQKVADVDD